MLKKIAMIVVTLCSCNVHHVHAMNMIVKPDTLKGAPPTPPQPFQTQSAPTTAPAQQPIVQQVQPTVFPPPTLQAGPSQQPTVAPVPTPPTPPPAPQAPLPVEKSITIKNDSSFLMNIRFETHDNPSVIDTILGGASKTIRYKPTSSIMYSFEELPSKSITPDMMAQGTAIITTPPELAPPPTPTKVPTPQAGPILRGASAQVSTAVPTQPTSATPVPSPMALPIPQLPPSASSKGPPGYKAERQ